MEDCLFCKIASKEIPANIVYEDEKTLAFLDINPINYGHTLVIPKEHSTNIFDIQADAWAATTETARKLATTIRNVTEADGVNININNGGAAGQMIFHPHIHIIPRYEEQSLKPWPKKKYEENEEEEMADKIRNELA